MQILNILLRQLRYGLRITKRPSHIKRENNENSKTLVKIAKEMLLDENTTQRYIQFLTQLYDYEYNEEDRETYVDISYNTAYKWASKFRRKTEYINTTNKEQKILEKIDR